MRDVLTTLLELAGAAAIVFGVALLSVPAACVVAGVLAVLVGVVLGADR